MNPFDLHGFFFLLFYLVVGIAILWALVAWIRHFEVALARNRPNLTDPYLIAHLRAGANEALRVATVSLIDRGLLQASDDTLSTKNADAVDLAQRPIEKAILKRYLSPDKAWSIFKDVAAMKSCKAYEDELADQGLLADGRAFARRMPAVMVAMGLLVAIALTKINIALQQGRHNIGFLTVLMIVFCVIALFAWRKRRTGIGDATLKDVQLLFGRLKGRAGELRAGGQTNEAALLAAVFGLSALPALSFPFTKKLYPSSSSDGSGCGSSGSSGGSCGGGCGGGGCGG